MRRFALAVLVACAFLSALTAFTIPSAPAAAATSGHHLWPLHRYMHGQRVKNLQWLLSGHRPSRHRHLKTYHAKIDGHYGPKTVKAVRQMKYLFGFPKKWTHGKRGGVTGPYLVALMQNKAKLPIPWIARAAKRRAKYRHRVATAASASTCVRRVLGFARSQIGVREVPFGSNFGATVAIYQSVTGAYRAPWCVSFVQWALWRAHVGPIADRTAGAVYLYQWAYRRGLLHATPKPGDISVWVYSSQHADFVSSVNGTSYTTVDGNYNNQVSVVHRSLLSNHPAAFISVPHCSG